VYLFDMEEQRMSQAISFPQCLLVLLSGVLVMFSASTMANPHDYGQFAQQEVSKDIPVAFITAESVKQRLDKGVPQWLVDVRDRSSYDQSHLPGATSLPLEELPQRFVEIPRDVPVVLY
jgi:Rhodanese-like domain